jgi:hypothetical protein
MSTPMITAMSPAAADVLQRALDLEPPERAKVVSKIIESLEEGETISEEEWLASWADEIERRAQAVENGTAKTRDAFEVLEDLRKSLAAKKRK